MSNTKRPCDFGVPSDDPLFSTMYIGFWIILLVCPPLSNIYLEGNQMIKNVVFSERRNFFVKYDNIAVMSFHTFFFVPSETITFFRNIKFEDSSFRFKKRLLGVHILGIRKMECILRRFNKKYIGFLL